MKRLVVAVVLLAFMVGAQTAVGMDKIGRITVEGVISEFPVPTSGSEPSDIVAGPDGAVWFTEFRASKVGRITTSGVVDGGNGRDVVFGESGSDHLVGGNRRNLAFGGAGYDQVFGGAESDYGRDCESVVNVP